MSETYQDQDGRADAWVVGGGKMGKLIQEMDWSSNPLGPIATWPQSLRTTVSLCLASNFPISLSWGSGYVQIYNDGYWPICGAKHPHSMGQDFTQCWASAWPVIGEAFERALAGETSYLENQRMFLDRNEYLEETFFTFSFSPIRDETGGVGGLFHPVTETTSRMLSERRTRTLRDLADCAGTAQTVAEAVALTAQSLGGSDLDLPFALFYLVDCNGGEARLSAQTGLLPGTAASPTVLDLREGPASPWPITEVVRTNQACVVDGLEAWLAAFPCGPYPEPPKSALALPLTLPGHQRPIGVLLAGVSARLPLDEAYRSFYDLIAAGVTTVVASASAYEEERNRAEALAEIDRAKTAFFSNISHEFRTPLTLMLGPLEDELAESDSPLPPPRRERLEAVHRNSLRLLKLVNALLHFSRLEAGRAQANYEPTDLAHYTTQLTSVFRSAVEKAGLTLTVDCPPLAEPIYVDLEMWEKIVLNLLSNAFKHTFTGGIRLALEWRGDHVELAVSDTGVGIPEADRARLFERFYRAKGPQARSHEGTGIGLALVKELVGLHGGTVGVESAEGQGSTFRVTLPSGRAHLPAGAVGPMRGGDVPLPNAGAFVEEALNWLPNERVGVSISPTRRRVGQSSTSPETESLPRILLADDNADLRAYVSSLLSPYYRVEAVPDGRAALDAAQSNPPDLVLSDVMMPRLDGFGLLAALRGEEHTRAIPVILLSARAGEEAAVEGLDAGVDDYLAKPFSARELLARVRTHLELERTRKSWAAQMEAADRSAFEQQAEQRRLTEIGRIIGLQRRFLADVLCSVTEGRLRLCDRPSDLPKTAGRYAKPISLGQAQALRKLRQKGREFAAFMGLPDERCQDFITAASEAGMNAIVHAAGGRATLYTGIDGGIQLWVRDRGPGIALDRLPQATLEQGYSSVGTLGHGFSLILKTADRVSLLTGGSGTTVVLEKALHEPAHVWQ